MTSLTKHKRLRFGMRTIKSALSVTLTLIISYAVGSAYPAFMAIGALGTMERSITSSIKCAWDQLRGNLVGALMATLVVLLFNHGYLPLSMLPFVTGVGTVILLVFCNHFQLQPTANLSCVVFVCLMVDISSGQSIFYGFSRFVDTLVGTFIALVINIVIRPYNHKPRIYSMITSIKQSMLPPLEQRVLRCRIPVLDSINKDMERLHREIELVAHEKFNSTLTQQDIAYMQGCEQLITKMQDALISICSLDATPAPNEENLQRLYALGLERTEQDNFLDGKCDDEDVVVLNYYLKIFLDAHDYLGELLEL